MPKPTTDDEAARVYRDHLLARYVRVVRLIDGDAIEIAPRPGHRLTIAHEVDGDRRSMRVVVGPIPRR